MSVAAKPTLMVIDGHSLAFRAFYALPPESFQTRDGQHTNAIHGFISMFISLLSAERPDAIAVAFDISRHSFRTREYPEYKGTRGETPPEFKGQIPLLQQALAAMGIRTIEKEDFEADDILATLARQGREAGYRVLLVSGDRDTIQLVNDDVLLLYPSKQGVSALTRYDAEKVFERYGVRPEQYPEIAALVGETSDNLPGVPRVGEKTAVKWIQQFGGLEEILARRDEITGKVGESLREFAHLAERNRRLNRLVTDVPLPVTVADLAPEPFDAARVQAMFARLEFRSLLQRVLKLYGADAGDGTAGGQPPAASGESAGAASTQSVQEERFPAPLLLLDEELGEWLRRESAANPEGLGVQVDVAATSGRVVAVAVASRTATVLLNWQPGGADYAPFEAWLASDSPKIWFDAKPQLKAIACELAAAQAGASGAGDSIDVRADAVQLSAATLRPVGGLAGDGLLVAWLLRPSAHDLALGALVERYLSEPLPQQDTDALFAADGEAAVDGTAMRAWFALRVHAAMLAELDEGSLGVYRTLELPLLPVLAAMELRGVGIDRALLGELHAQLGAKAAGFAAEAYAVIGREVNLGSPKQLQQVLFEQLDMPKTRATKTGYSTDAAALQELQRTNPHPFLGLLLQHRDSTKLRQIVETLERAVGPYDRVHTSFVQVGTSTGRLASTDPNVQNIPVRSAEGRRIRQAFRVGEGFESLLTADYSQIEMRIMAHLSGDAGLIEAFHAGEDLHRFVGARIFGVTPEEVTGEMRSTVKAMSYGLVYGLSAFGLAKQLNLPVPDAKQLMSDYFARFGAVREYLRQVVEQAKVDLYTETILGRRRLFPELSSPNRLVRENAERAALNAPIQGSAADIMKLAMIGVERSLAERGLASRLLLQVHDEVIVEVAPGELAEASDVVFREMSQVIELKVPLEVQLGHGDNWDAGAH